MKNVRKTSNLLVYGLGYILVFLIIVTIIVSNTKNPEKANNQMLVKEITPQAQTQVGYGSWERSPSNKTYPSKLLSIKTDGYYDFAMITLQILLYDFNKNLYTNIVRINSSKIYDFGKNPSLWMDNYFSIENDMAGLLVSFDTNTHDILIELDTRMEPYKDASYMHYGLCYVTIITDLAGDFDLDFFQTYPAGCIKDEGQNPFNDQNRCELPCCPKMQLNNNNGTLQCAENPNNPVRPACCDSTAGCGACNVYCNS